MKSRWIIALLVIFVVAISANAQENSGAAAAEGPLANLARQQSSTAATSVVQPRASEGSQEDQTYPARLEAVVGAMSAELGEIVQAAREGKISRDQADYLSFERYYVALTRFQLLRMLYQTSEVNDPPETYSQANNISQPNTTSQSLGPALFIPPVTCSPDIPPQLADYLQLTPSEIKSLDEQVEQECKQVEPLVDRLDKSRRKLVSMKLNGTATDKEVQAAAAEQAQIIKQLIVMNSQLEAKLYSLLTAEQQRKVDGLLRQTLAYGDRAPVAQ